MEVGQGPNWSCSVKEKKLNINAFCLLTNIVNFIGFIRFNDLTDVLTRNSSRPIVALFRPYTLGLIFPKLF
jgi:hypothetical protein